MKETEIATVDKAAEMVRSGLEIDMAKTVLGRSACVAVTSAAAGCSERRQHADVMCHRTRPSSPEPAELLSLIHI